MVEDCCSSGALKSLWVKEGLCQTEDEANALWDDFSASFLFARDDLVKSHIEYFGLSEDSCRDLVNKLTMYESSSSSSSSSCDVADCQEENSINMDSMEFEDGEDDVVGEGECELCGRSILVSRHHLIPRSTWPRVESRLLKVANALDEDDREHAVAIAGPEFAHLIPHMKSFSNSRNPDKHGHDTAGSKKAQVRHVLQFTGNICRPCHSMIHRTHDNMTLAWEYNTLEKILSDPKIQKFSKWASHQRTGQFRRGTHILNKKSLHKTKVLK